MRWPPRSTTRESSVRCWLRQGQLVPSNSLQQTTARKQRSAKDKQPVHQRDTAPNSQASSGGNTSQIHEQDVVNISPISVYNAVTLATHMAADTINITSCYWLRVIVKFYS